MALPPPGQRPPSGDYITTRARDTSEERADAEQSLRANGCQRFHHETLSDGRLQTHGYVRAE